VSGTQRVKNKTQRIIAIRCLRKKHRYERDLLIRLLQCTAWRWKEVENQNKANTVKVFRYSSKKLLSVKMKSLCSYYL